MKSDSPNENGDDILLQLPFTYEPHNLEFSFDEIRQSINNDLMILY